MIIDNGKYYVMSVKTSMFIGVSGMVSDKNNASKFDINGLRKRFGMKFNAKSESIISTMQSLGFVVINENDESVSEGVKIEVIGDCDDNDILFCKGVFVYRKDIINKNVVYCKFRGLLRLPEGNYGELLSVKLYIIKITGKII